MDTGFTVSFNYNGEKADDLINKIATLLINSLENYSTKNAFYTIRNYIRENPDKRQ